MAKNEDGEFELILGNRQLLSVFFIVVILLGVFFTMGYIVGRNSSPVAETASTRPYPGGEASEPIAPRLPESQTAASETSAPVATAPQRPEPDAAEEKKSAPVKAETAKSERRVEKEETAKPVKADREAKTEKDKKSSKRVSASDQPQSGQSYLQLAATSRHEADILVDVLRKKGFKSLAAEIEEKPGTFRVLVGPVPEGGTNKLRADLQSGGFPGNAAIRRSF